MFFHNFNVYHLFTEVSVQYGSYPTPFPTPVFYPYPSGRVVGQNQYIPPPPPPPLPQFQYQSTKKPFFINVNPVYPTPEKFTPYFTNSIQTTEQPVKVNVPVATTTEAEVPTTQIPLKQATEEPIPVTTIPPPAATERIVDIPETTPIPTSTPETITNVISKETTDENEPSIRISPDPEPVPASPSLPVIVPTLPPNYRRFPAFITPQVAQPYPQPTILGLDKPVAPSFYNTIPIQTPASCPCYVMTKNSNGTTSTTTQSPIDTVQSPPSGLLVLLYPLCPGDSINQVQQIQPALSSAFIIPYPCGQCDPNKNVAPVNGIPQYKSFQEAVAQGSDFRSPTLILSPSAVPDQQVKYRVTKKKIVHE